MFICCEYGWWCEEYIFSQSKPHGKWHTKSGLGKRLKAIAVATALSDCLEYYEDLIVEKMERKRCSSNRRRRVDGWRRRRKSGKSYSRNGEQGAIVSEEEIDRDEL